MAKGTSGKAKLFALYEIMRRYTDENHGITIDEIQKRMKNEFLQVFETTPQTIKSDFELLGDVFHIRITASETYPKDYRLNNKSFYFEDIEDLYASLYSNSNLTEERRKDLVKSLKSLCSHYEAARLTQKEAASLSLHKGNALLQMIIQAINQAITNGNMVFLRWRTEHYGVDASSINRYMKNADVLPIEIFYNYGTPYLYCRETFCHFENFEPKTEYSFLCIDLTTVEDCKITEKKWWDTKDITDSEIKNNYPVSSTNENFEPNFVVSKEKISLLMTDKILELAKDTFKDKVEVRKKNGDMNHVFINTVISPKLFGWIFQYGEQVKFLSPLPVVNQYKYYVKRCYKMYFDEEERN